MSRLQAIPRRDIVPLQQVIADLPNRVCHVAGSHLAAWHTLWVVGPVSTRTRSHVAATLPHVFPDVFTADNQATFLDLPPVTARTREQVSDLLVSPDYDAWTEALVRVGNCAHPIKLRGRSETVDTTTGEIVSTYSSEQEPLGVTHVRCGNRRASECPSCSRLYAADMFQLIRAGVAGGKTVPVSVAENPLVFATLTAPSFGAVHGRRDGGRRCHPYSGKERGLRARPATQVPGPPRPGRPRSRTTVVRGLLRLRLASGVAVVGTGPMAPVHHRLAPAPRQAPASPGEPAGRGRDGAVRQGR